MNTPDNSRNDDSFEDRFLQIPTADITVLTSAAAKIARRIFDGVPLNMESEIMEFLADRNWEYNELYYDYMEHVVRESLTRIQEQFDSSSPVQKFLHNQLLPSEGGENLFSDPHKEAMKDIALFVASEISAGEERRKLAELVPALLAEWGLPDTVENNFYLQTAIVEVLRNLYIISPNANGNAALYLQSETGVQFSQTAEVEDQALIKLALDILGRTQRREDTRSLRNQIISVLHDQNIQVTSRVFEQMKATVLELGNSMVESLRMPTARQESAAMWRHVKPLFEGDYKGNALMN